MTMLKRAGVNCKFLATSQGAKPTLSPPFSPGPRYLGNCINSALAFACIAKV
jgi:hypothetical protein